MSILPTQIGHQDLAALIARQPEVAQRWRTHVLESPFGNAKVAAFNFPRPLGTLIPEPPSYRLASLGRGDPDLATGSLPRTLDLMPVPRPRTPDFPTVNRSLKGDLLVARPQKEEPPSGTRDLAPGRVKTVIFPRPKEMAPLPASPEPAQAEVAAAPVAEPPIAAPETRPAEAEVAETAPPAPAPEAAVAPKSEMKLAALPQPSQAVPSPKEDAVTPHAGNPLTDPIDDDNAAVRLGRLYFGTTPVGPQRGAIQPWPSDEELVVVPGADPDIKRSALAPVPDKIDETAPPPVAGETVAPKGEVTGPGRRPKTPAERLGLTGKARAKAEKCLTEAIYFESRGEAKRGQIAVAQVVLNRVFSGYYPTDVCGVVYQNAHRKLACQFTFACDNVKDVVNEPDMWEQAKEISRDMLDGKIWLSEIGKSTHYHAYWVHPWWVRTMIKRTRIGVHTFYRPRRWGDGADAPIWGPGVTFGPGIPTEGAAPALSGG